MHGVRFLLGANIENTIHHMDADGQFQACGMFLEYGTQLLD
jgi:hypothetical protein